jgi:predicted RNA-binding protein
MICLPRPDLQRCIEKGVFGLPRKHIIQKVQKGDCIVCCAGKDDWKIIATGQAVSDYYLDDSPVFLKEGFFIDRFKFETTNTEREIDLKSMLDELSFVTNLAYWAVYFRNGLVKMTKADWELIQEHS